MCCAKVKYMENIPNFVSMEVTFMKSKTKWRNMFFEIQIQLGKDKIRSKHRKFITVAELNIKLIT